MPDYGSTDRVRKAATERYVEPARRRGETKLAIHSGTLGKVLIADKILAPGRFQLICDALESKKFLKENCLTLLERQAPPSAPSGRSSTINFVYRIDAASSSSASSTPQINSFLQLRGILKKTYKQLGGAKTVHETERESWNN